MSGKPLSPEALQMRLRACPFFDKLIYRDEMDSTNKVGKRLAEEGAEQGTVVITDYQTAGKGRKDRRWISPPNLNLLFSIVFRPNIDLQNMFLCNVIASLGIIQAIESVYALRPLIKWPNDIYLNQRKLGGILTEFQTEGGCIKYVVVGVGLNVNWYPEGEMNLRNPATSLKNELGTDIDREDLLVRILCKIFKWYEHLVIGNMDILFGLWKQKCLHLGKVVQVDLGDRILVGVAKDIDHLGNLEIQEETTGQVHKINWGDVSIKV